MLHMYTVIVSLAALLCWFFSLSFTPSILLATFPWDSSTALAYLPCYVLDSWNINNWVPAAVTVHLTPHRIS